MKKKRFLSLMLSILILVCPVASMLSVQGMDYGCYYIKGDTDGNGVINIRDATTVQRILAEYEVPIDDVIERANVTGGDTLTVNDATEIQKYLAEYANTYSVGKSIFAGITEGTPLIVAEKVAAQPGDTSVAVRVSVKDNPGITSLSFDVGYDTSALTLTSFAYNESITGSSSTAPFNPNTQPVRLSMVNGSENIEGDWLFATLYFDVKASSNGNYPISLAYEEDDIYNIDDKNVAFELIPGEISVKGSSSATEAVTGAAVHIVTFKDSNGGVILSQTVEQGQSPIYPVAPELDGYVFRGWDKVVCTVTEDVVITAIYDEASGTASAPSKISELQNDTGYITGREDYCFSLPPVIYTGLNGETRIYPQNIFTPNYMMYWGQYTNATTIREHGDYVSLVGTSVASKNIKYRTYDKSYRMIESGTTRVVINSEPPESQTMLLLGDSFISQNYIGPDLRALFAADGNTLTLIGTKSTSPKLHEGYAGWKYTDFTNPIKASSNAFWNSSTGKFDFSHYMTANGYSNLNSVYIQLGTNDASASYIQDDFADTTAAAREIVSSILDYDPNIKIYLGLTVMPTLISTNFAAKYNGVGVPWIMRYNMQRLNAAIIAEFSSDSAVKIVATNCILDSSTDIADNVHPNEGGYQKIAQQLYYTMMN